MMNVGSGPRAAGCNILERQVEAQLHRRAAHTLRLPLLSDCDDCSAPAETNCCAFK